jgi:hypothetical protein
MEKGVVWEEKLAAEGTQAAKTVESKDWAQRNG